MKKFIVVLSMLAALAVGYAVGSTSVLHSPKWVTEEAGLYIISTEFNGNVYEDVSEKESHMMTSHKYVAYVTERSKE